MQRRTFSVFPSATVDALEWRLTLARHLPEGCTPRARRAALTSSRSDLDGGRWSARAGRVGTDFMNALDHVPRGAALSFDPAEMLVRRHV